MATPLETVKKQFGSKESLVSRLVPMLDRPSDETDDNFTERLLRVSNKKLLKLLDREQTVREKFGSREALVDRIVSLRFGRADADYRRKISGYSTGRLLSMHAGLARKA